MSKAHPLKLSSAVVVPAPQTGPVHSARKPSRRWRLAGLLVLGALGSAADEPWGEAPPHDQTISGRVVDAEGTGVDGIAVEAVAGSLTLSATTAGGGRFVLGPVTGKAVVAASLGTGVPSSRLAFAPRHDLEIQLGPVRSVDGEVYDQRTSEPIGAFQVTTYGTGGYAHTEDFADAGGAFSLDLPEDVRKLEVRAPGYAPWLGRLDSDGQSSLIDAPLGRGRWLAGRVVDADTGTPVVGATVEVDGSITQDLAPIGVVGGQTDSQGEFKLRVRCGNRSIRVQAAGYATKLVVVPADAGAAEVALARGSTVAGHLVLPDGSPAPGRVGLRASRPRNSPRSFWEVVDRGGRKVAAGADGSFRFDNVPAGSYFLWARSTSGAVDDSVIDVAPKTENDASALHLRLAVQPLATVAGAVSGLGDAEMASLRVVQRPDGEQVADRLRVGNGPFRIAGIPNGRYTLVGSSTTARSVDADFEIDDLETAHVDIAFRWSSRLRGQVLVGGAPIAPSHMEIVATPLELDDSKPSATTWVLADGSYAIAGLADASYLVEARGNRFDVHVSGDTEFDLALPLNALAGTIWAEGERLGGGAVRAVGRVGAEDPVVVYARIGKDAEFRLDGLPAGEYAVAVMDPFWQGAVRHVTVNAAIQNFDFWLEPADDLQPIRILRSGEPAEGTVEVDMQHDVFGHVVRDIQLDKGGVGFLPNSLQGADLRLSSGSYSAEIPHWNGAAALVELEDTGPPNG